MIGPSTGYAFHNLVSGGIVRLPRFHKLVVLSSSLMVTASVLFTLNSHKSTLAAAAVETTVPTRDKVSFNLSDVIVLDRMKPKGQRYEATVPDTLDLAKQTEYAINALIGDVDPSRYYG